MVWWNSILLDQFDSLQYALADLGVINDFFTNALYAGRPFWITNSGVNHLLTHFTPTAIVLVPAYLLTDSQYVLIALSTAAMAAALWIGHLLWRTVAAELIPSPVALSVCSTFLVLAIGCNRYVREVLSSGHFEIMQIPLAVGFFYARLCSLRLLPAVALFALAIGVREEAGLFLAFQALALSLLPEGRARGPLWRRQNAAFAAAGLVYVLFVVKVINPLVLGVGDYHVQRGWSQWGDTWPAVAWTIATSPVRTVGVIGDSAFLPLNASFGFLVWLHPIAALLVNLPAVLLYSGSAAYQKYLWYYNAAFILPGFILLTYAAGWRLARWVGRLARGPARWTAIAALGAAAAVALLLLAIDRHRVPEGNFAPFDHPAARADAEVVRRWSRLCGHLPSVATDVRHLVYAPLASFRYSLSNTGRADVVFIFRQADATASGVETPEEVWRLLEGDDRFILRDEGSRHRVYARRAGACPGLRAPGAARLRVNGKESSLQ